MNTAALLSAAVTGGVSPSPTPTPTAIDPSRVTPGVLGFLAVVFMAVCVFFLWKSLNKQLKRVDFDEAATDRKKPRPDATDLTDVSGAIAAAEPVATAADPAAAPRDTDQV